MTKLFLGLALVAAAACAGPNETKSAMSDGSQPAECTTECSTTKGACCAEKAATCSEKAEDKTCPATGAKVN